MNVEDAKIIELPKFLDARGNLSFAEQGRHMPFNICRVYWLYDVPGGVTRGGHAEKNNEELVISLSGSFEIMVDDGKKSKTFVLNRSYVGLYIPKGLWREIKNFSTNAFALEFGSMPYFEEDYIRDYEVFKVFASTKTPVPFGESFLQRENKSEGIFNVFDCSIVELDRHHSDRKGNLTVINNGNTLPFDVKRAYYIYDVPGGENRGAHAHKELEQLIIAASGSFTVTLDDGGCKRSFFLNRPYQGLYVKPGMWRDLVDFSSGAVALVLASDIYKQEDYIRDYEDFIAFRKTLLNER